MEHSCKIESIMRFIPQGWNNPSNFDTLLENRNAKYADEILDHRFFLGEIQRTNHEVLSDIYNLKINIKMKYYRWNEVLVTRLGGYPKW